MVHACNPSYTGEIGMRIIAHDPSMTQTKITKPYLKNNESKNGLEAQLK
jgi:hypothetical protein